jgi:hypothetical protein
MRALSYNDLIAVPWRAVRVEALDGNFKSPLISTARL